MAYNASYLKCAIGGGFTQWWDYYTTDALATVNTSGYFNDAAGMLRVGDSIWVHVIDDLTKLKAVTGPVYTSKNHCVVTSNTGTVVDVTDGVAVDLTDGD